MELKELLKNVEVGVTTTLMSDDTAIIVSLPKSYFKAIGDVFNDSHREIVGDWVTAAINEKYGRDFGKYSWMEPENDEGDYFSSCEKCGLCSRIEKSDKGLIYPPYCKWCGQRLLPPEGVVG